MSLSITRELPETAWRAAHKGLLPGLHHQPRRTYVYPGCRVEIPACPDAHPVGIADGPKTWRERFAGGARLLSRRSSKRCCPAAVIQNIGMKKPTSIGRWCACERTASCSSPDGRTWFIPKGYPGRSPLVPLEMLRVSPDLRPPPPRPPRLDIC